MEVKKAGNYKTKNGREVEVYGFDDLGGGPVMAEGFFKDTRNMGWWEPETGKYSYGKTSDPELDLTEVLPKESSNGE